MITREEAERQLFEWTKSDALRKHARMVEITMRAASHRYGNGEANIEQWGIAGLLHDADYDQFPEEHPRKIVAWLRERGEDAIANAVACHYTKWKQPCETQMDKALLACDELTGFVGACCLVRPDGIDSLEVKSVKKKLKDKSFAAKVDRDEIAAGVEMLGVSLDDHIRMIINALKVHKKELGV